MFEKIASDLGYPTKPRTYEQAILNACEGSLGPEDRAAFVEHLRLSKGLQRSNNDRVAIIAVRRSKARLKFNVSKDTCIYACRIKSESNGFSSRAQVFVSSLGYLATLEFHKPPEKPGTGPFSFHPVKSRQSVTVKIDAEEHGLEGPI